MSVVLHPTEQLSGETSFTVISVGGENDGDAPVIAGVTGNFADSLQGAEVSYSEATGEITVTARFGMGHMATSAASATTMAQHWWMQSVGSLDRRDMQQLAGLEDTGVSAWIAAFHEEGSVDPTNDLQDVSFDQKLSGLQTGIEWKGDVGGGSFSVGPMFSYGNASANQNANLASAMGDASAYGLNASYRFKNGLYLNATWQQMAMEIDFRTPGTLSNAIGTHRRRGRRLQCRAGLCAQVEVRPHARATAAVRQRHGGPGRFHDQRRRLRTLRAGWQALAAARRTVGVQDLRNRQWLHHAAGEPQLPGRDGR